jgi:hypothetical protein
MNNQLEISPEVARLAQQRVRATGTVLSQEIARLILEEAILQLDPEFGFMVESDVAYSANDALSELLGVNDIVVNGVHIDVRAVTDDGAVTVPRGLVIPHYLTAGSITVVLDSISSGRVAGHVTATQWRAADAAAARNETAISVPVSPAPTNLVTLLNGILASSSAPQTPESAIPDNKRLLSLANGTEIPINERRELVQSVLTSEEAQDRLAQIYQVWSKGKLRQILASGAEWNRRVESIVARVSAKFSALPSEKVRQVVLRTGESFGGQPEAPEFKRALLDSLGREELLRRVKGADMAKVTQLVERVLSGKSVSEAVGSIINNKVAVDLAMSIKKQRRNIEGFVAATADEIGMAFQQLALQPAYATHSRDPQAGVETINEALSLIEAGEVAEQLRQLESEL